MRSNRIDIVRAAKNVFDVEIEALRRTRDSLDADFRTIVSLILHCRGKVVITGVGKPGHVASKMSSTLASLGTPSFFLHPSEAMHGDLGMLSADDVVMLLSNSGESTEVTTLLPAIKEIGCTTIAITGNGSSSLARQCMHKYVFPAFEEACYLHLAPTSSTTALMAFGDALAVVISKIRNYTREDFSLHHPAGSLGKMLTVRVSDLMHSGEQNATVLRGCTLKQAILEMSSKGLGMVAIVDEDGYLCGIITDGDLRRMLEKGIDVYTADVDSVMTKNPKSIDCCELAVTALQRMSDAHITTMPALDETKRVVGVIQLQGILRAGIVI